MISIFYTHVININKQIFEPEILFKPTTHNDISQKTIIQISVC
jgi:hypothetical protein